MNQIIIAILCLVGAVFYHLNRVDQAYKDGRDAVQILWDKDVAIREAVYARAKEELEKQLVAEKQRHTEAENEYEISINAIKAKYVASDLQYQRLRKQLASASTSGLELPGTDQTQCLPHVRRIEEVSGLLAESTELLRESGQYIEELGSKVKALQEPLQ